MWLRKFEVSACQTIFASIKSEEEAAIFAGMLMRLTDRQGDKPLLRQCAGLVLECIVSDVFRKMESLESILDDIELFLEYGLDLQAARADDYTLRAEDRAKFQELIQDPRWKRFVIRGNVKFRRDVLCDLYNRLRSFFPGNWRERAERAS